MTDTSRSDAGDNAWLALGYFAVYMGWLFLTLEGEVAHWATMVLIPVTLVTAFNTGTFPARLGQTLRSFGLRPERPGRGMALTVGLCLAVCLFQINFSRMGGEIMTLLTSARAFVVLPAVLLFLLVLTALTEEIFFRGYLQTRMERLTGSRAWGLVVSSILFGVYHLPYAYLNPNWPSAGDWSAAWASAMGQGVAGGLILGGLFLYTGRNLYAPILLHAAVNLLPGAVMLKFSVAG